MAAQVQNMAVSEAFSFAIAAAAVIRCRSTISPASSIRATLSTCSHAASIREDISARRNATAW